ncbi:ATP-binding protein [Flavobacterium sp. N1719]|uniref:ATP-binding protein n=1 Tax=Flavobacterium sp. N1719 TaxID=2885633 RepID=UPI002223E125|nr:ATP-binding protein [Flavobacterium sp. N1719]
MVKALETIALINSLPIAAIVVNSDFKIVHINPNCADLFSIDIEQFIDKSIQKIFIHLDIDALTKNSKIEGYFYSKSNRNYNLSFQCAKIPAHSTFSIIYINIDKVVQINTNSKRFSLLEYQLNVYNQFLDTIKEGIFVFNDNGQLIFANKKSREYFQLQKTNKNYFIWELFQNFVSKLNWDLEKKAIEGQSEMQFFTQVSHGQIIKTFSVTISQRTFFSDTNYLVIIHDITENKLQAEEIQKKEYELNIIYRNLPVSIFEFVVEDFTNNYFSYLSESFKRIFPIDIAVNNKNWHEYIQFNPQDFQLLLDKITRLSSDEDHFNFIGRFYVNQETIWFEITSNVYKNNNRYILNGVLKNISENKKIEDEIVKKGKFNNIVLDNIPADIAVFDENHNYKFVNKRGIEDDELRNWLINKSDFDYCALKGLDNSLAQERREYFIRAKNTKQQVDWVDEIKRNGTIKYIYRRFYPVFVDQEFNSMIGYGIDVTELKQSQNLLNHQNAILKEKNKELERFAYIASHDLQEPLISIIGYSEILKEYHNEEMDEEIQMSIDFIHRSATRMRTLINALMEYSRIENKENLIAVDINNLIHEIKVDLSSKIKKTNAIIKANQLPTITCYPTFTRVLFQNIIVNALKYTQASVQPIVVISSDSNATHWIFKIEDNGIGIDPSKFDDIFQIFKRLHNQHVYEGNGIGLAHCKKIVNIHNGEIWVESNGTDGSTFYFSISKKI